jgi:spermidine synthase
MNPGETTEVVAPARLIQDQASGHDHKHKPQRERWTRVLCVLFFFSGFPALIYQLVWQRALFRIFGVNIESVTIIVTAFMLGLGLGSLAGGWMSKKRAIPLLPLLASIELLTGLFGIVSLNVFDKAGSLALGMPLPLTALVTLALVAIPTLLMGATLPILVGHLVNRSGNVGNSVGLLYYVNTLGAGAACLVASVLIFPFSGMQTAIYIAVGMNAAVACGALAAYFIERRKPLGATIKRTPATATGPALPFAPVVALAFAGGCISLSYEIFFVRAISYGDGGMAASFATTLGVFLVGIASGSRQASEWCNAADGAAPMRIIGSVLIANLIGFLFLPVLAHLAWLHMGLLGIALLLVYLLARYWGALLPCLAHFGVAPDARAGTRTALLYFANIVGSATGSILTGFVLMDRLSLVSVGIVLVAAGCACAMVLSIALPLSSRSRRQHAIYAIGIAAVAATLLPTLASGVLESLFWKGSPNGNAPFAHVLENRSGIITVDQAGAVYGNGMYDGRFNTSLMTDTNGILRPYALSLFHREPHDVLMIGLSSGSWAQVIANNPQVDSLTVIEINPGYLELIAQTPEVASVLKNPKVRIVIDDGRRWLRLNPGTRFDAIVSNTTWYFRANASNLLSTEFMTLVRQHLNPGGIFFYNTTDSARVQRTACLAFPYGARFTNHMLVSTAPLVWDFDNWRRTLADYRIDGRPVLDLANAPDRARMGQLMAIRASLTAARSDQERPIESCPDILARTAGNMPVTDDNMGSEWRHEFRFE